MSEHLTKLSKKQLYNAITYIKQGIKRLSQGVSKNITPQQVEDQNDDTVDSLKAALSRLDPDWRGNEPIN